MNSCDNVTLSLIHEAAVEGASVFSSVTAEELRQRHLNVAAGLRAETKPGLH